MKEMTINIPIRIKYNFSPGEAPKLTGDPDTWDEGSDHIIDWDFVDIHELDQDVIDAITEEEEEERRPSWY